MRTLRIAGYVEQDASGRYRLGLRLFVVGASVAADLREAARPFLRRLAEESGETVSLVVRDHAQGVVIAQEASPNVVAVAGQIGQGVPLHCTAAGKVLLAWLPARDAERLIAEAGLVRMTPRTITDRGRLWRELGRVRRIGVAFDRAERRPDVRCTAAPVSDYTGEVIAAISLSGPMHRVSEFRLQQLGRIVKRTCGSVSRQLGWKKTTKAKGARSRHAGE
jgi:IclR family acetate operon transcriptional repressor